MAHLRRPGLTTTLTAIVLVALPVLAALQFHWLSHISEDARSRMLAVVDNAGRALSQDLGFELAQAWNQRAADRDASAATDTDDDARDAAALVVDALIVDSQGHDGDDVRLRRWDLDRRACTEASWPGDLAPMRSEAADHRSDDEDRRMASLMAALPRAFTTAGVLPVLLGREGSDRLKIEPPCEVKAPGLVLVRFDMARVRAQLVPELVRRHLAQLQGEFKLAIVSGASGQDVVYANEGTDPSAILVAPDSVVPLSPRWDAGRRMRPEGQSRGPGGPPRRPDDGRGHRDGEGWRLVAQHRTGSLDAAVTRLRNRNLFLSLGILGLMGIAVAMIAGNARKAERLARQQVEFVASVSHEMRTPVAAIDVAARNLEDGVVTDPSRIKQYGGVIRVESRRLAETIERVLQVAALDAGRGIGPLGPVDAHALVDEIVARMRREHPTATIEVVTDGDGPMTALADATVLRSCIQNLVGNALKYGGSPSWTRVTIGRPANHASEIAIAVEDRGQGIDKSDLPHVFDPFYRGRLAIERRHPGNGLGLHIVKRGIAAMGGRVDIRTGHGAGTTFTLHVPAAPGTTSPPAAPAS